MPKKTVDPKHRAVHIARNVLYIGLPFAVLTTISYFVRFNFWLELFVTYSPQIIIFSLGVFILCFSLWYFKATEAGFKAVFELHKSVPVMLVVLFVLTLANMYLSVSAPVYASTTESTNTRTINVMTFNKFYTNELDGHALNYIRNKNPDVLALQEIFKSEAEVIAQELGYTHWHIASCGCSAYGSDLALFSKFPIASVDMAFEDRLGGFLRGEVELGLDDKVSIYVAHVIPPYGSSAYELRPEMFDTLIELVNAETNPVIALGDFNSTQYSTDMRSLSDSVSETIRPIGDKPWPKCSWFGASDFFCARIDHIYIPTDSFLIEETIGPSLGSDHRPIEALITI